MAVCVSLPRKGPCFFHVFRTALQEHTVLPNPAKFKTMASAGLSVLACLIAPESFPRWVNCISVVPPPEHVGGRPLLGCRGQSPGLPHGQSPGLPHPTTLLAPIHVGLASCVCSSQAMTEFGLGSVLKPSMLRGFRGFEMPGQGNNNALGSVVFIFSTKVFSLLGATVSFPSVSFVCFSLLAQKPTSL